MKPPVILLAALTVAVGSAGAQTPTTRSTAALLTDLARDYGMSRREAPTAADIVHVRVLLRAALRLDPGHVEAYRWLHELAVFAGDTVTAQDVLAQWADADPANETVLARWLAVGPRDAQTAERRAAWLRTLLARPRPAASQALIHVHLGRLALQRVDRAAAQGHLDEARRLFPDTPEIAALAIDLLTPESEPAERIAAHLDAVRFQPTDAEAAWRVGVALDEIGFHLDAGLFYDHALRLHRAEDHEAPIPVDKLLRLAINALARDDRVQAAKYGTAAIESARGTLEPALLMMWMASLTGDPARVEPIRRYIRERLAAMPDPDVWPTNILAQAAWFYTLADENLDQALSLAEKAAQRAPGDAFVQRVLGWALAANGQAERAVATLAPLAATDGFAAYKLIELKQAAGEDAAAEILARLRFVPAFGPVRTFLEKVGLPPLTQPVTERLPAVVAVLERLDRRVLDFDRNPSQWVVASIAFEQPAVEPTQPWVVVLTVENTAPYPVTLGAEWMVHPLFLISLRVEDNPPRELRNFVSIEVDRVRVLPPGGTVSVRRTIDVGPVRRWSRFAPGRPLRVTASAVFDPQRDRTGQWQASAAGQYLRPASLERKAVLATPEAWNALFAALSHDEATTQFRAIETMAQALGEQQRADDPSTAERTPADRARGSAPTGRIEHAFEAALLSDSWEVRVRVLDAMQLIGLGQQLVATAAKSLAHNHWLVRLMAVRLLARQGPAFLDTARRMASEDADELVRDLAQSYVDRWSRDAAGSQPAR